MINKVIILLLLSAVLVQGVGAAGNMTMLETFPDGQAKKIAISQPPKGWWQPSPDGLLYIEYNSYGQVLKFNGQWYAPYDNDEIIYYDNGELVFYNNTLGRPGDWIPKIESTKKPKEPLNYKDISFKDYQRKFSVNTSYMQDGRNYQTISDNLYKLTPEYQAEENRKLKEQLDQARMQINSTENTTEKLNKTFPELQKTVAKHDTWLNNILNWINQTFSIDLR